MCIDSSLRAVEMKRFYGLHNDLLHLIDGMFELNQNSGSVASSARERTLTQNNGNNNNYAFILQPESEFCGYDCGSLRVLGHCDCSKRARAP